MRPLYILKLGGSVVTCKDEPGILIRHDLLIKIALAIKKVRAKKEFDLIIVHGAGSVGHQLAKKYNLTKGTNETKDKIKKALITCNAIQELNNTLCKIFITNGLMAFPIHTASTIIQRSGKIKYCNLKIIKEALRKNCLPVLYGDMVFDNKLGMSVCSGDAVAPYLAEKLKAEKIFFASDIDGIFTKDPHLHKDANLLEIIALNDIKKNATLSGSHNIDVTSGLLGKIKKLDILRNKMLKSVEIFNGLRAENYTKIFLEEYFSHTKIFMKKRGH